MMRIGVDAGGTFTDFVILSSSGQLTSFKLRSNPMAPHEVILAGLERAASTEPAEVVHGSTVATNALLERKGARTAFITTDGFEDILEIGRQNRPRLYDLTPGPKRLLVPPEWCFGVPERTLAGGAIELRPGRIQVQKLAKRLRGEGIESAAICFLHSYLEPANERLVASELRRTGYLSVSHVVCPEFREYERASTTALNAYVGPVMRHYLAALRERSRHSIWVMQSNGGTLALEEAGDLAVRTILSGPAGGVKGALETARAAGFPRILGFDMGGTSTDVSLCDGVPRETSEALVDGLPVKVRMLEIQTVGAGGGSIARVDPGGLLRVGPESAGAEPGPACYGLGTLPTVTDAHAALGRIGGGQLAGGSVTIDVERARAAVGEIASRLELSLEAAAAGILRVANATMSRAIRVVSVERGFDPRDFALVAFGGCGGLHACDIAEELGVPDVIVPQHAGALSALGMLLSDRMFDYAAGVLGGADPEPAFRALEAQALERLPGAELARSADLRFAGQSYELNVPWEGRETLDRFLDLHRRSYGYTHANRPVEIVTVRLRAVRATAHPSLSAAPEQAASLEPTRSAYVDGAWRIIPVLVRAQLPESPAMGPALVVDYGSTTLVGTRWAYRRDRAGNLLLRLSTA